MVYKYLDIIAYYLRTVSDVIDTCTNMARLCDNQEGVDSFVDTGEVFLTYIP